jgi:hypothetical protein
VPKRPTKKPEPIAAPKVRAAEPDEDGTLQRVENKARNQTVNIGGGPPAPAPPQTWGQRIWSKFNALVLVSLFGWCVTLIMYAANPDDARITWLMTMAAGFSGALVRDLFGERDSGRHSDFPGGGFGRGGRDTCCCKCHGETTTSRACTCPCHPDHKREEDQPGIQA